MSLRSKVYMRELFLAVNSDLNIGKISCRFANQVHSLAWQSGVFQWALSSASQPRSSSAWLPGRGIPPGWACVENCSASGNAGWPFWKGTQWFQPLGKAEVAVAIIKEECCFLAPKGILSRGFHLRNRKGHWCVVGCCPCVKLMNRITEFMFRVTFRKSGSSALSFLWLFRN